MEKIINENIFDKTKKFIFKHINDEFLNEDIKHQFISAYGKLTTDNAAETYTTLNQLYQNALDPVRKNFRSKCIGSIILTGGIIGIAYYLRKKYISRKSYTYKFFRIVDDFAIITIISCIIILIAKRK